MVDGKDREFGIGKYPVVSLADAREKPDELRKAANCSQAILDLAPLRQSALAAAAGAHDRVPQAQRHRW